MSITKGSISLNSSVESNIINSSNNTDKVKNYVKDLLKSRIFLGRYVERRLIDQHIGYRDIVLLSAAEVDLKRDLVEAQNKLRSVCPNIHWIGITDTEQLGHSSGGLCLWTEIENQPFGPFWFQIRSLKFRETEIIIMLKCIRHISDAFLEIEPILTGALKINNHKNKSEGSESLNNTYNEITEICRNALTIRNVKEFMTFLFAFTIAIFTGSTAFVNFVGNFILALLREFSILVKNGTPWFLGLLDFFSKIVGGFYILLAMFFRQSAPNPQNKRTLRYYNSQNQQSGQYDTRYLD